MIIIDKPMASPDLTQAETVLVGAAGALTEAGNGLATQFGNSSFFIAGSVMGGSAGLMAGAFTNMGGFFNVELMQTGTVFGINWGVRLGAAADYAIDNAGMIRGATAISIAEFVGTTQNVVLRNLGTIWGGASAVTLESVQGVTNLTLTNYGRIIADAVAITNSNADALLTITNHGEIFGAIDVVGRLALTNRGTIEGAVLSGAGQDSVINRGTVEGGIFTGAGNDTVYDQRGRDAVEITLGDGDDIAYLGAQIERVVGGKGLDTVSYAFAGAVTVNLASGALSGAATGDVFEGVEIIEGSARGDILQGDGAANQFRGLGGADVLAGSGGADRLEGGRGADTLTGGTGSDRFVFASYLDGGDVITDFTRGPGGDKIVLLQGFTGDLVPGALDPSRFVSATDNQAQDVEDRLIFNTTDHTLWADPDGSGAGFHPVLIATFANGVDLTAGNFLVI